MNILHDLHELVGANVITSETAHQISDYYKKRQTNSPGGKNKQLLLFGILGAFLVGIGLLFIVANKWEELPRSVKTACAFLLLIVPQLLCVYAMYKKADKVVWLESTALILFFAVCANISLVSQIYHINGDASTFIFTWMMLTVPLVYIMNSSAVSIGYLIGILSYSFAVRFDGNALLGDHLTWLLFLVPIPHYFRLIRSSSESPLTKLLHWVIPGVLTLNLGTVVTNFGELMPPVYFTLFGIFYFIGSGNYFRNRTPEQNGYLIIGTFGSIITLIVMSFQSSWEKVSSLPHPFGTLSTAPEFVAFLLLFSLASGILYREIRDRGLGGLRIMEVAWFLFILIFVLGFFTTAPVFLINLAVFATGVLMIRKGAGENNLSTLNSGMIVITILLICRSFDIDLTYFVKGLMFVGVGIGFFITNWWMLKKQRKNEAQ
ncbi:MAG: DUF2157 domain-containing protein [Prolixibacteraceae bacterium]|jgi:uncharacterized membrane protein|nr:DUF2157 domain-containing protein [Prolixibacteraceae bacterium]